MKTAKEWSEEMFERHFTPSLTILIGEVQADAIESAAVIADTTTMNETEVAAAIRKLKPSTGA